MSPRYRDWLSYVFDRPVSSKGWYFDIDIAEFVADNTELVGLIADTMQHCGRDLAPFSDAQVRHGLNYVFNNSCSDVVFSLKDESVPIASRLHALQSIKMLYRDCFTSRCATVLGHTSEPGATPLNYICYMLWDMSPIARWEKARERMRFYEVISDVMADALRSPNPACIESALHGLGHIQADYPKAAEMIDTFLGRSTDLSPDLRAYAQQARVGRIQ